MPAPTVTILAWPDAVNVPDTIPRPSAVVKWTGGAGPFDVLHEWDTDSGFGSPITDSNPGATSPDTGVPPSDLGPAGTTWHYRARVTDTSDATFTQTNPRTLNFVNPRNFRRYLYLLASVGPGFETDVAGGPDGDPTLDFRRYLYLLASVGPGFDPTDTPVGGWGPAGGNGADGETLDFRRYLYLLANVDTTTPTPHIWYLYPTFGEEGDEFSIIGYGFGDTQGTYTGTVTLDGDGAGVVTWELIAETNPPNRGIDPVANLAEPIHQRIRAIVPTPGSSGVVIVCTDGP